MRKWIINLPPDDPDGSVSLPWTPLDIDFKNKDEAIDWAKEYLGADDEGRISVIAYFDDPDKDEDDESGRPMSDLNELASKTKESTSMATSLREKYIDCDGACCPYCGSINLSADSFDTQSDACYRVVQCDDCKQTWTEAFTLTDVAFHDEGEQ